MPTDSPTISLYWAFPRSARMPTLDTSLWQHQLTVLSLELHVQSPDGVERLLQVSLALCNSFDDDMVVQSLKTLWTQMRDFNTAGKLH
jgi:hypothetical protein